MFEDSGPVQPQIKSGQGTNLMTNKDKIPYLNSGHQRSRSWWMTLEKGQGQIMTLAKVKRSRSRTHALNLNLTFKCTWALCLTDCVPPIVIAGGAQGRANFEALKICPFPSSSFIPFLSSRVQRSLHGGMRPTCFTCLPRANTAKNFPGYAEKSCGSFGCICSVLKRELNLVHLCYPPLVQTIVIHVFLLLKKLCSERGSLSGTHKKENPWRSVRGQNGLEQSPCLNIATSCLANTAAMSWSSNLHLWFDSHLHVVGHFRILVREIDCSHPVRRWSGIARTATG